MFRGRALTHRDLRLGAEELGLWALPLTQTAAVCARLGALLSTEERERAERFVFERDYRHFVVCRGALRRVLGAYLGAPPEAITFAYSERGKPSVSMPGAPGIEFNVSHAADLAVFAFSRAGAVGIDVESRARMVDFQALAARFFSPEEAGELLRLPDAERRDGFFNCWTRKEAYIKATGDGLSCPLDSFSVTLRPREKAAMRSVATGVPFHLIAFLPAPGYAGAVATRRAPAAVNFREWSRLDGAWPDAAPLPAGEAAA
jgi:4'-phosphopantetheinyl transferase